LASASAQWSWDGSELSAFRSALSNLANFGPAGTVNTTITTTNLSAINAGTLAGIDVFVSPFWEDSQGSPHAPAIITWFLNGGSLFLLQDDSSHDPVGDALLLPAIASNGTVSNGTSPLFNGPFGTASNVTQAGNRGAIGAANVTAKNGTVMATNASGQITAAYWAPGEYAAGAGALLILGDVDMLTSNGFVTYAPLDDNGRFALNGMALLASDLDVAPVAGVPEPASVALLCMSVAGMAGYVWQRRRPVVTASPV
jgi:hypothetical protein